MNSLATFKEFLATSKSNIPIMWLILNLISAAILAKVLELLYVKYGTSLSNRKSFAKNFFMITTTTMLIISVVKSSLALSLGLVGALSIIRFRTAIKEPEELTYLFFAIAIGLGFGANQGIVTSVAFFIIVGIIILLNIFSRKDDENCNLYLSVASTPGKVKADLVIELLKDKCSAVSLRRLDENQDRFEAAFLVVFEDFKQLNELKLSLKEMDESLEFRFLDNKGTY